MGATPFITIPGWFNLARIRWWVVGLAVAAIVPAAVACGGSSSSKSTPTPAATQAAANSTGAASPTKGASGATAAATATTASSNGLSDLQKASKDLKVIDYHVSYDSTITDASGSPSSGSITMSHKGNKSLMAIDGTFGGSPQKVIIIDDGTSTFVCTDQGGQKTCLKTKSGGTAPNPFLGLTNAFKADTLVSAFSKDGWDVKSIAGQKIAGRDAKCYSAKGPDGSGTVCLDSQNGMLLLLDGTNTVNGKEQKTNFKAKEATDSPPDADFNPPYPVQSLPGQ